MLYISKNMPGAIDTLLCNIDLTLRLGRTFFFPPLCAEPSVSCRYPVYFCGLPHLIATFVEEVGDSSNDNVKRCTGRWILYGADRSALMSTVFLNTDITNHMFVGESRWAEPVSSDTWVRWLILRGIMRNSIEPFFQSCSRQNRRLYIAGCAEEGCVYI